MMAFLQCSFLAPVSVPPARVVGLPLHAYYASRSNLGATLLEARSTGAYNNNPEGLACRVQNDRVYCILIPTCRIPIEIRILREYSRQGSGGKPSPLDLENELLA